MNLPVTLRPGAEADLLGACGWYEERLPGLGGAFLRSVDARFARIQGHPEAYPEAHPRVREPPVMTTPRGISGS